MLFKPNASAGVVIVPSAQTVRWVYKCINCKLSVHKKCHKLVTIECGQHSLPLEPMMPEDQSFMASDPAQTAIPHNSSSHEGLEQVDEENEAGNTRESGKASSSLGLQDFDLLRVLGRGSYAKVLLVQLKKTDRIYEMKIVKKELANIDQFINEPVQLIPDDNDIVRKTGRYEFVSFEYINPLLMYEEEWV
ncbi:Protein kinase C iota type [Heterocephalus glaber]|uniref:Protein kinase C iota type n=1 Tax=Heterocephalus glaber TaxID=10181 RepID=G5BXP9_HETGA|nr:Protein kinase C iota type [Heterocephalus glaber]